MIEVVRGNAGQQRTFRDALLRRRSIEIIRMHRCRGRAKPYLLRAVTSQEIFRKWTLAYFRTFPDHDVPVQIVPDDRAAGGNPRPGVLSRPR